ncbi:MAG: WG repeat-containing protein [Microscillaceae bacterium]|nr:WG repeat-containing protein [Microscillaceae bacterium]
MRLFFLGVALLFFMPIFAQKLIPYRRGDSWGFANKQLHLVIPCMYEQVEFFEGDLARIKKRGYWGLIDSKGKEFVPCAYDMVYGGLKKERIVVCKGGDKDGHGGRWGIVPRHEGKEIVLRYDLLRECGIPGFLGVYVQGKWGVLNTYDATLEILPLYEVEEIEDHHFEDISSSVLNWTEISKPLPIPPRAYLKLRFDRGFARVKKNGKWGYINYQGLEMIPTVYEFVGAFAEGLLCAVKMEGGERKIGFVDRENAIKIPFEYDFVEEMYKYLKFEEGLIPLRKNGKWGYVNALHEVVIPFQYTMAGTFREGRALVSDSPSSLMPTWKCIDRKGNTIFELDKNYQLPEAYFEEGFLQIKSRGLEGFLNHEGKLLGSFYEKVYPFKQGLAQVVRREGDTYKTGFINSEGEEIIPLIYDYAENSQPIPRRGAYLFAAKNGLCGVIDLKNQEIISFSYREMLIPSPENHSLDRLAAKKDSLWGFLDRYEKWAIQAKYELVQNFQGNYALVKYHGRWGYIHWEGKEFFED